MYGGKFRNIVAGRYTEIRKKMESSPVNENSALKADLCTPTEHLSKQHQEITPDNPTQPGMKSVFPPKKVPVSGFTQKLSKRKLFGQLGSHGSGSENDSETVHKKKRSDDPITNAANDNTSGSDCSTQATVKRHLTERQQLAFLLEVTSTRVSEEDESANTVTKIKSRKKIKTNGKSVNPRVYRRNKRGETPLHIAAIKGDAVALKKLIKDGAEINMKDYAGWTALHEACNHGNLAVAKLLVKHGATVNVPGFQGDTPLHDAVVNNHVKVVNMLLSCGADAHQTNSRQKKPIDLIRSKEMSDMFHLHGVQHQEFKKTDKKSEVFTTENVEKAPSDNERSVKKSSILGNEIQRKETQGESRMEKPVMYICKLQPRNEELTLRTTQVTSYMEYSNVEGGGSDVKNLSCEVVSYTEPSAKQETSIKETLDIDKRSERVKVKLFTEEKSLENESRDQPAINETSAKNKLPLILPASEELKAGAQNADISGKEIVSVDAQDNEDWITKAKLLVSSRKLKELEEIENEKQSVELKQVLIRVDGEVNDHDIKRELSSLSSSSEGLPVCCRENRMPEKKLDLIHVQGRVPNESAKTGSSLHSCERLPTTSPLKENEISDKKQALIHIHWDENETAKADIPSPTSGDLPDGSQEKDIPENSNQLHLERSRTPEIDESIAVEVLSTSLLSGFPAYYDFSSVRQQDNILETSRSIPTNVHVPTVNTTLYKDFAGQETTDQSNEELFLDVESLDHDLKENLPSAKSTELRKRLLEDQSQDKRGQVLSTFKQELLVFSTSNDDEELKDNFPSKDNSKSKQQVTDYPRSMVVSIPVDEKNGFSMVAESGDVRRQADTWTTLKFDGSNSRSGRTDLTSWKFDEPTSENNNRYGEEIATQNAAFPERPEGKSTASSGRGLHNETNLRYWQTGKKALKVEKRGRRKVGVQNAAFTREDEMTKQKAVSMELPISNNNQDNIALRVMNVATPQSAYASGKESRRSTVGVSTTVVKPSKPAVTWQSLMYAERCQLAQLGIPGYDQFLMKTKEYELAKDANQSLEEPIHSLLTEKQKLSLKHEKSKESLLRKQRSEQDKLQLCMEQEIVRFYTKNAYFSLKCNQPPGVCTAIYWQNMSSHQLQREKKKCSQNLQKLYYEQDQTSQTDHQEIIEKYNNLKVLMGIRHKHEQQAFDAVAKRELQSCV